MSYATSANNDVDQSLSDLYDRLWRAGERALRQGAHQPDEIPRHGDARWGLSLVIAIEGGARETLRGELDALRGLCRAPHVVYSPAELHVTVRSLEGFADDVHPDHVARYAAQIRAAVAGMGPVRLTLRGLGGSPGGLFVRGFASANMRSLRQRLFEAAAGQGALAVPGADANRVRDTAHVSLVVFRPPVVPEPELARYVDERRDRDFGAYDVATMALVRYRPTDVRINVEELARIPLG